MRNGAGAAEPRRSALRRTPLSPGGRARPPLPPRRVTLDRYELPPGVACGPAFASLEDEESPQTASYRTLAQAVEREGYPRVILVSSARRREGRTTCALNLALALRRARKAPVLLLELDRAAPVLSDLLYRRPRVCLTRQLAAHAARAPADEHTWSFLEIEPGGLHVAPIHPLGEPRPLCSAPSFEQALVSLRRCSYRYVVIDGPPVLASADLPLLLDGVEGILLTARHGRSRQRDLREAAALLPPEALLGSVLIEG